jgi:hypothetical protein
MSSQVSVLARPTSGFGKICNPSPRRSPAGASLESIGFGDGSHAYNTVWKIHLREKSRQRLNISKPFGIKSPSSFIDFLEKNARMITFVESLGLRLKVQRQRYTGKGADVCDDDVLSKKFSEFKDLDRLGLLGDYIALFIVDPELEKISTEKPEPARIFPDSDPDSNPETPETQETTEQNKK